MKESKIVWATDTIVSRPDPVDPKVPVMVDFEGFAFTMNGMAHNLSEADIEQMTTPTFAPDGYRGRLDENIMGGPEDG